MRIENPVAFSFILQDDLYLLNNDKIVQPVAEIPAAVPEPVLQAPVRQIETPALNFNYLGKLKKQYLILVFYPGLEVMPAPYFTALENTLKRLAIELDDVAILNLANYKETVFEQLSAFFKPQKLLILGGHALPKGLAAPPLNKQVQVGVARILFTFSFDEMMDNNDNKKVFWEQMKQW
ncbi:hypothetical protein [Mucilaginibacter sp.]|uniref:hypothetical protein n=1 Tax=Mucilaginibacter sp. TaxID=1882438 RepID=UPI0028486CE5|nr:hypothetical protein [Mucilaginibacter sp.]MDR3694571.1 hypothetical protein [Mucilaginibacter sp.]